MDRTYSIKVNESLDFNFAISELQNIDFIKISETEYHLINNNKTFKITVLNTDFQNKTYTLKINSKVHTVNISNPLDLLIKEMGFSIGNSKKSGNIKAPMPGLILNINVKEGQKVKEGDTLLVLEAMKMENAISAENDGTIKSVNVKTGNTVEKGELLIEFA